MRYVLYISLYDVLKPVIDRKMQILYLLCNRIQDIFYCCFLFFRFHCKFIIMAAQQGQDNLPYLLGKCTNNILTVCYKK